jgi:transketolase
MTVLVPADATEAYKAVLAAAEITTPAYIRLGRYPTPVIFDGDFAFEIGAVPTMREGDDVAIYATGIMTALALDTAEILAGQGIEASVLNVATIKPLNTQAILDAAVGKRLCVAMEEHWISGGLGSAVAETLSAVGGAPSLLRIGVEDQFGQSATADELLEHYELTPTQMAERIGSVLQGA